ncbi:hypothetical protein B0H13DRAFT_2226783 [Mycena leptocephala]|nr:hypothetical protein B0H13DRAFT_2226783 [Mycena leptocephala]
MAAAFATATGQDCHIYHSRDTRGRGRKRQQLTGLAAEAAWSVPVKEANDLGGKVLIPEVPYVPGMAVFCTENLATELGIVNGSPGTLVSIVYEETDGRRYAISAEVDFKAYKNSNPDAPYPHRVNVTYASTRNLQLCSCLFNNLHGRINNRGIWGDHSV